jgi:hypothetical protein
MLTYLGKNNHPLPSIGVVTHTISQLTSSCMEKNITTLSTASNGTLSWRLCTCIALDYSLGRNVDCPCNEQSSITIYWGDNTYNFTIFQQVHGEYMITISTTSNGTLSWI